MYHPTYEEWHRLRDEEMKPTAGAEEQRARHPLLPLYRDILADMETPVSAYCKTAKQPYSFLLESVSGGEHVKRYSFIGIDPYMVMIQHGDTARIIHINEANGQSTNVEEISCHDPLEFIDAELSQYRLVRPDRTSQDQLPIFHGGAIGYLAYDVVTRF